MSLFRRTPAAPPTPEAEQILQLEKTVARLEIDLAIQGVITAKAEMRAEELVVELAEARQAHSRAMSKRVRVDELPTDDIRHQLAAERRNNVALSNQLADAEKRPTLVRQGSWS